MRLSRMYCTGMQVLIMQFTGTQLDLSLQLHQQQQPVHDSHALLQQCRSMQGSITRGPGAHQLADGVARSQQKSCTARHSPFSAPRPAAARCCALPGYCRAQGATLPRRLSCVDMRMRV